MHIFSQKKYKKFWIIMQIFCIVSFFYLFSSKAFALSSSFKELFPLNQTEMLKVAILAFYGLFMTILACYFGYRYLFLKKILYYRPYDSRSKGLDASVLLQDFYDSFAATSTAILIWTDLRQVPLIYGRLPGLSNDISQEAALKQLELWLPVEEKHRLKANVKTLCLEGKIFDLLLRTNEGAFIYVIGQIFAGRALVRFQEVSKFEKKYAEQTQELNRLKKRMLVVNRLFDKLNAFVFLDESKQSLLFANKAYKMLLSQTKETKKPTYFLQSSLLEEVNQQQDKDAYSFASVVEGERRFFDFYRVEDENLGANFIVDQTEFKRLQQELDLLSRGYTESFDLLPTAVAIFDENLKLRFANRAFASLWQLDDNFLETEPNYAEILDRLHEKGLLPEELDWREFKENLLTAYQATETVQYLWVLPDGRTIRVFAHPQPKGGVIWLYENLTEKVDLQTRYNTLIKTQGETLDYLSDGVVVFGSDGRICLTNNAFIRLWDLPHELAVEGVHIREVEKFCKKFIYGKDWAYLTNLVTGSQDERDLLQGHMNLTKDLIFSYMAVPLPEGQTLISFKDATAEIRYAQALKEKNEVLQQTEKLRFDFIKHVSYELRTPLTTLIGYTEILEEGTFGPLNEKQKEFLEHIASASKDLLNIVNDILDLASVDAGIMTLHLSKIAIAPIMQSVLTRVEAQRSQKNIHFVEKISPNLPDFYADAERVRQLLIKLALNAIQQSPRHSEIEISVYPSEKYIVFAIKDKGYALDEDMLEQIFQSIPVREQMGMKSAVALTLSLAKSFVELHEGIFKIEHYEGEGNVIYCYFQKDFSEPSTEKSSLLGGESSKIVE